MEMIEHDSNTHCLLFSVSSDLKNGSTSPSNFSLSSSPRHRSNYLASPPMSIWSPSASTRCSRENGGIDDDSADLRRVFSFDEWLEANKENSSTFCPSRKFFSFEECVDSGDLHSEDDDDYGMYGEGNLSMAATAIIRSDETVNQSEVSMLNITQSTSSLRLAKSLLAPLATLDDLSSKGSVESPVIIYNCDGIPRVSDTATNDKSINEFGTNNETPKSRPPPIVTIPLYQQHDAVGQGNNVDDDLLSSSVSSGSDILSFTLKKDASTLATSSTTQCDGIPKEVLVTMKSPLKSSEEPSLEQTPSTERLLVESTVRERYQRLLLTSSFRYDDLP